MHSNSNNSITRDCTFTMIRRRAPRAFVWMAMACVASVLSARPAVAQVYQYQGNPFTSFSCGPSPSGNTGSCSTPAPTNTYTSYLATDSVSATLTFTSPLGPNFSYADVSGRPGFQLILSDGHQVVSTPIGAGQGLFAEVSTDATGQIDHWRLVINTGGTLNGGVNTRNFSDINGAHVIDQGVLACCDPTVSGNLAANFGTPGTWSGGSGNPSPASLVSSLINVVSDPLLGLTSGQVSSLTDKLNKALASIQAGQNKQAINQLQAFINAVQSSLKTGRISAQTAATLTAAANAIIALL